MKSNRKNKARKGNPLRAELSRLGISVLRNATDLAGIRLRGEHVAWLLDGGPVIGVHIQLALGLGDEHGNHEVAGDIHGGPRHVEDARSQSKNRRGSWSRGTGGCSGRGWSASPEPFSSARRRDGRLVPVTSNIQATIRRTTKAPPSPYRSSLISDHFSDHSTPSLRYPGDHKV